MKLRNSAFNDGPSATSALELPLTFVPPGTPIDNFVAPVNDLTPSLHDRNCMDLSIVGTSPKVRSRGGTDESLYTNRRPILPLKRGFGDREKAEDTGPPSKNQRQRVHVRNTRSFF